MLMSVIVASQACSHHILLVEWMRMCHGPAEGPSAQLTIAGKQEKAQEEAPTTSSMDYTQSDFY